MRFSEFILKVDCGRTDEEANIYHDKNLRAFLGSRSTKKVKENPYIVNLRTSANLKIPYKLKDRGN